MVDQVLETRFLLRLLGIIGLFLPFMILIVSAVIMWNRNNFRRGK